jgi:hypothetical protein
MKGSSSSSCGSSLVLSAGKQSCSPIVLVHDKSSAKYLTPGTYLAGTIFSAADVALLHASSPLNQTTLEVGHNIVVSPPPSPVLFANRNYVGDLQVGGQGGSWKSTFMPAGYYSLVAPGQAVWGGIPDISQIKDVSPALQSFGLGESDAALMGLIGD